MDTVSPKWFASNLEGNRVLLRMKDGDIEGLVSGVCEKTSRLSLKDVVDVETKEPLLGQLHCHAQDIASCVVLENSMQRKQYILIHHEDEPRVLRVRTVPPHMEKLRASVYSSEFICHRMEGDTSEFIKEGSIKFMGPQEDLPELKQPIATEFEVVDKVNDHLSEAIAAIKSEQSVSIGCEGKKIGRRGFLSVLVVATSSKVYIFDVFALEKELFSHGLKDILESKDIEKVIHGCRHLSDCLYHQYQVSLDNVFDTMMADVIIHHNTSADAGYYKFPGLVRGVQSCVRTFLKFNYLQLKYTRSRQGSQEEEVSSWKKRPLSLRQIDALVKDVVFLGELAQACLGQMLRKFHAAVNFFLTLDRDCTEQELGYLPPAHVLPKGFANAVKCATSRSEQQWRMHTGYDRKREDGQYGRKENNRSYERKNTSQGPSWVNADKTQPRDASCRGGQIWGKGERSQDRTCKEDSLFYIGMKLRAKGNHVPGDTTAPILNGTCNGSESQGKSPGNKEEGKKPSNVPLSEPLVKGPEHASDSKPPVQHCTDDAVKAVNGKHPQDLNGDQQCNEDIQYGPLQKSRLLSLCLQRTQPTSVPERNAAVCGQKHASDTIEVTDGVQKEAPTCCSTWGSRPIDSTAGTYSIRPAEMIVQKHI